MPSLVVSFSHGPDEVRQTIAGVAGGARGVPARAR